MNNIEDEPDNGPFEIWFGIALCSYGGQSQARPIWREFGKFFGAYARPPFPEKPYLFDEDVAAIEIADVAGGREDGSELKDPTSALPEMIKWGAAKAVKWLRERPLETYEQWRATGRRLGVFVGIQAKAKNVQLTLPIEFSNTCTELGLEIKVYCDLWE
jgi:hypothetical protein